MDNLLQTWYYNYYRNLAVSCITKMFNFLFG